VLAHLHFVININVFTIFSDSTEESQISAQCFILLIRRL